MMTLSRRTLLAAGAAIAMARPAALHAQALAVVKVGIIPSDTDAVVSYAAELGYFKNNGLDVQVMMLTSGPTVVNAVVGGSVDIGAANVGSLLIARSRGLPVKLIAPAGVADRNSVGDIIAVRKDSPIRTAADLNGKTMGIIALKTMQHAAVLLWLDRHGADSKTVKFVEILTPEMGAALEAGRVDAIIPNEPFTTMFRPNVRILANQWDSMRLPFMVFGLFATESWLQSHTDQAQRFAKAITETATWANGHRRETADILVKTTKVDPQIASTMGRTTYGTTLSKRTSSAMAFSKSRSTSTS